MKQFKDYHLYLGCKCTTTGWGYGTIKGIDTTNKKEPVIVRFDTPALHGGYRADSFPFSEIKLILRPLSDMTEEEAGDILRLNYRYEVIEICRSSERFISYRFLYTYGEKPRRSPEKSDFFPVEAKTPEAFKYLLSKHFDLFGLIKAGLAIDATTLETSKNVLP